MSQKISISLLALTLLTSASFVYADWKPPTATPPNENVAAPINVSGNAQDKAGVLTLGGLGVFGSALITSTGGYTLPSSLSLGVNGYVGAKGYCDEKGNNCVSTLGGSNGSTVVTSSSSSSGQIFSGWPNAIMCDSTTGTKKVLRVDGYYEKGRTRYSDKPGYMYGEIGSVMSIYFDATTKKSLIVHGNGDYGGNGFNDFPPCFTTGKSISDFRWID